MFNNKKIDIKKLRKIINKAVDNFRKSFKSFKKKKSITLLLKNKFINYFFSIVKFIFALIFTPLFLMFSLFEIELFLKVFKQIIAIIYFLIFLIFVYTLFNQNKLIEKDEIVVINIDFKDKVRNF